MSWTVGDVSHSETLTAQDHLYETHINELRVASDASATFTTKGKVYQTVFDIRNYVIGLTSSLDNTAGLNACIADAMAANGAVYISGYCRADGEIVIPYTGGSAFPVQNSLRIFGAGATWNGYWHAPEYSASSSVLDLRYAGGGTAVAKIDTRGAGLLELDHLTIKSGGSDNYQIMQTTNTTVLVHDNCVIGNSANSGRTCAQDFLLMGGSSDASGDASDAIFQGYGSKIQNNFYDRIQHAITFGQDCNGIEVENETVSKTCGSADSDGAPYYFNPAGHATAGVRIKGGTVEITNYRYLVMMNNRNDNHVFDSIGMYDDDGSYTLGAFYFSTDSAYCTIYHGYANPDFDSFDTYMTGPGKGSNSMFSGSRFGLTNLPQGIIAGPLSSLTWTSISPAHTLGTNMTIDSGTGGSNVNIISSATVFKSPSGTTVASILGGTKGVMVPGQGNTAGRPNAVAAGNGGIWFDTTLGQLIISDGADWSPLAFSSSLLHSPLTTKGDIWSYSSAEARRSVGTNGQVLQADSTDATGLSWTSAPSLNSVSLNGVSIPFLSIKTSQSGTQEYRWAGGYNTASSLSLVDVTNSNDQVIIVDGGKVGIGKTPSAKFDVNGTIAATTFSGSGASLTGIPESGVTNLTSDLAAKFTKAGDSLTGQMTVPAANFDITNPPIKFSFPDMSNANSSKGGIIEWGGVMDGASHSYGIATYAYQQNNAATFTAPSGYKKWAWVTTHFDSPLVTSEAIHQHFNIETVKADWLTAITRLQISFGEDVALVSFPNSNVKVYSDQMFQIGTDAAGAYFKHDTGLARIVVAGDTPWNYSGTGGFRIGSAGAPGGRMHVERADDGIIFYAKNTFASGNSTASLLLEAVTSGSISAATKVTGESVNRFSMNHSGKMEWGSGSATRDVNLYRGAANVLKTDWAFTATTTVTALTGVGYTTGAGGTITQSTSKSTGVTLNKASGAITLNSAALAADTTVSFVFTNSLIAAGDVLVLNHSATGAFGSYNLNAHGATSGSVTIDVRNISTGSLSEAIVISYAIIKAVTA